MSQNRNIDIARVEKNKPHGASASSTRAKRQRSPQKPLIADSTSYASYFTLLWSGITAIFSSEIFLLSLLRNLLSLRVLCFAILPLVYFQLHFLSVLKPDQALVKLKLILAPSNTFQFIMLVSVVFLLMLASWLADTIIIPALIRLRYQQLDRRKALISAALADSLKGVVSNSLQKLTKLIVLIFVLVLVVVGYYAIYLLGYGSLSIQIWFYCLFSILVLVILCLFISFKFWLQASTAIGSGYGKSKFLMSIKQVSLHPGRALCYGISWLGFLSATIFASLGLAYAEILLLQTIQSVTANILWLAIFTTLLYILWSIWSASQVGFWTALVRSRRHPAHLVFSSEGESGYMGLLVVVITILLISGAFLAICVAYSSQLSLVLSEVWSRLPDTIKINLTKP